VGYVGNEYNDLTWIVVFLRFFMRYTFRPVAE